MTPVLFVTNGHGEASIAKRIAQNLRELGDFATEHFALVGAGLGDATFRDVGPQAAMPSGGLVAMGNVRAFAADVQAGFFTLLGRQLAFLRRVRGRYALVVAVGDVYALLMARLSERRVVFVGTAKSVYVAPYGLLERRVLATAARIFVRDSQTAAVLRRRGIAAEAPGNVIVDLLETAERVDWHGATERIALLPGSRSRAYGDARRLAAAAALVLQRIPSSTAVLSVAPGLDADRFGAGLADHRHIAVWTGDLGALLADATLALGQAGTANEAAAACGVPVVALDLDGARKPAWYRMRQAGLLGEALAVVPGEPQAAAEAIVALLCDAPRRERMTRAGRERLGDRGGATAIARAIAGLTAGG